MQIAVELLNLAISKSTHRKEMSLTQRAIASMTSKQVPSAGKLSD